MSFMRKAQSRAKLNAQAAFIHKAVPALWRGLFRVSKKWLDATFLSFTGFASRIRSRAAKSAKYENLWVFIRSDAHVVRAELNIRGCGPLSTLGFFDRLGSPRHKAGTALLSSDFYFTLFISATS